LGYRNFLLFQSLIHRFNSGQNPEECDAGNDPSTKLRTATLPGKKISANSLSVRQLFKEVLSDKPQILNFEQIMLQQPIRKTFDIGDGRMVTIETGRLARQADGAVTVSMGNCMILATVVATKEPKEGQSFFPLSVDYQEKFAAAGRIPGSFFKREARLNDYEVLTSRLIDRALRPLFPEDYLCEVQVLISLISSDEQIMPDALACLAASAALAVSDIPIKSTQPVRKWKHQT
jgi:hypothetical protein